jgi:hypothetical protein
VPKAGPAAPALPLPKPASTKPKNMYED